MTLLSLFIFHFLNSHLIYACQVWGQRETMITKRVFLLQKRAIRIICNASYRAHTDTLFLDLRILKFFDFVKYLNLLFVYNFLNNKLPSAFNNIFHFHRSTFSQFTRRSKKCFLALYNFKTATYGQYSIQNQAISIWNHLHETIHLDDLSVLSFSELKHWSKLYFLSLYVD